VLAAADAETLTVEGPDGSFARVVVASSRGEAVFLTDGMPETSSDEIYELWLIDDDGPAPAGLFDVDERGRATRVLTGDLAGAAAIAVTVEPAGGSPQPTSDPLMVVELDEA
jgi:anti-sigma-K factor RskA